MEPLSAYLPLDRQRALVTGEPLPDRSTGAVLFADISGFTPLTAALEQELGARRGAEEVTGQLNRVFSAVIEQVDKFGGSVVNFSGDAITCWFDEKDEASSLIPHPSSFIPHPSSLKATACALAMQTAMRPFATVRTPAGTPIELAIKVSAVAGTVRRFLVGDPNIHQMEVLAGRVLDKLGVVDYLVRKGEVLVAADVASHLAARLTVAEWREDEQTRERYAVVTALEGPVPQAAWPVQRLDDEIARPWLLPPVYERLHSGQGQFLSELRPAAALFLEFSGIDYDDDDAAGEKLDAFICWVQNVIARYEGFLLQLSIGEKGSYLYASFGAPIAHEDDAERAIAAALDLITLPARLGFIRNVRIGLSRGQMRTGAYGGPTRRTYGVMGSEANIACRLMQNARPRTILASERILAGQPEFDLEAAGRMPLKGVAEPVPVSYVRGRRRERSTTVVASAPIVGRQTQRHILAERLRALIDGHMDGAVIIEAEAGMGKSRLVMDLLEQAATQAVQTLIGAADAVEQSTPYYAWRAVFNRALGLDGTHDPSGRRARVLALLEHDARLAQWAPLLSEFLQLDLPDNETTAQMTGPARADNLQKLLADVLALAVRSDARSRPLLLIIEDGHWLDSSSWALIPMVMRQIQPMLIVVATRPLADPIPPEYWRLIAQENSDHLQLEALPVTDIEVLVCRRLGVTGLPQAVADFIREQAEGHPFFSEELAFALRDTGILRVTDSECRLAPGVSDLRALDFPTTIEGVITSRIDSLPPQSQLAVKVASIIGRAFPYHILEDIYPVDLDRPRLPDHLEAAARLDIVRQDTPEPQLAYLFKHIITQEVAYSLLLFTQRQQLHRAVAEWYERAHANDLSPYYSLLAYHWSKAAEDETASIAVAHKAIDYLDAAGEQALRNSAYREAIRFFEQAFKLESQVLDRADRATGESAAGRLTPDRVRRQAHRHLRLGEAYRSWGYLSEARKAFERTAALYGYPTPTAKRQMIGGLIGQAAKQVLHRLRPARYVGRAPEAARPMLLETSTSYQYAAEVYYFANEVSLSLYTTLLSLNLSERVGDSRELVNAYAVMGIITGAMGKRNWAEAYFRLAEDTARRLNSTLALGRLCSSRGLYYLEAAQWDQADENLSRSMAILEEIGDKRYWGDSALMLAAQASFIGEFDRAIDLYEAMTGPRSGSLIHRTSSAVWQGRVKILQGRLEEAIHLLNRGLELSADAHDPVTVVHMKISAWSFLAGAYLRQGDLPAARQAADAASQIVAETRASARQLSLAFDYLAEVYIALWASESSPGDRKRFEDAAQRISRALLATQRPGQTRAWRCRGLYEWQAGRPAQAHRAWQKSLSIASGLRMPYEQAQAHYEIGRHLPTTDPARREHLRHAREIFARIGAAYDLALTEKALEQH